MKTICLSLMLCSFITLSMTGQELETDTVEERGYYSPTRKQVMLTSLLPLPFGNRVFYDGKEQSYKSVLILGLESLALLVAVKFLLETSGGILVISLVGGGGLGWMIGDSIGDGIGGGVGLFMGASLGIASGLAIGLMVAIFNAIGGLGSRGNSVEQGDIASSQRGVRYALLSAYFLNILDAATFEIDQEWIPGQASLEIAPIYDVANQGAGVGLRLRF